LIDVGLLEFCVREDLNKSAKRVMAVLDPVKLVITNYPTGQTETVSIENNPEDPNAGHREVPFGAEVWIERDDFMETPPKGFFRLGPGLMVRLKGAYIVRCDEYLKDADGHVREIRCTYIPESRSGSDTSGLKVKGTIHWVSCEHAQVAEARLYDRLFTMADLSAAMDFMEFLNPNSLRVLSQIYIEPSLKEAALGERFQFIRKGYFCLDPDTSADKLVFNMTVGLKDTWAKEQAK
jgi:glutaminyl-tRNA synthetase